MPPPLVPALRQGSEFLPSSLPMSLFFLFFVFYFCFVFVFVFLQTRHGPGGEPLFGHSFCLFVFCFSLSLFTYFERDGYSAGAGERQRERIPYRLRAVSAEPDAGLELTNYDRAQTHKPRSCVT